MKFETFRPNDYDSNEPCLLLEPHDTWSMDVTLSKLIGPMLLQLKSTKHGIPKVDDEDVPLEYREGSNPSTSQSISKWDYVMDEMIWAFDQYSTAEFLVSDKHEDDKYIDRIERGTRLFGKYYSSLWD